MAGRGNRERVFETGSEVGRKPRARQAPPHRDGVELTRPQMLAMETPSSMLALQRLVGNRTVAVMIGEPPVESSRTIPVQRGNRLYTGNLSFNTTQAAIEAAFAAVGEVREVAMPTDRETGQPRGFAFVTMGTAQAASDAISQLNGAMLDGRPMKVNEAQERPPRGGGGGGGFGGGGGGGGGRGGGGRGGGGRDRY
jgi:cold-inducible RNA-binding protein